MFWYNTTLYLIRYKTANCKKVLNQSIKTTK